MYYKVFGPEHRLKLGASSKCANKLLGLLRKGVADMSPPIKIVLVPSNNQPITSICRPNLEITFFLLFVCLIDLRFWHFCRLLKLGASSKCANKLGSSEKRGCRHFTSDQDRACSFKQSTNNIYLPPKSRNNFFPVVCLFD